MSEAKVPFPLLDSVLFQPEEGRKGHVGIATNTSAPGQVVNEIDPALRTITPVYGSLIVSMGGTERMVVNSLVHPTLSQIVLVGTETSSFRPSSNLLQALQYGFRPDDGNRINNGVGVSAMYPNLNEDLFDTFREHVAVLPAFMSETPGTGEIITSYLSWLDGRIDTGLLELLREMNTEKKIYFDRLNQLLSQIGGPATREKVAITLEAKDFQALQPPVVELETLVGKQVAGFRLDKNGDKVVVDLPVQAETGTVIYHIEDDDEFALGYALNRSLGDAKDSISPARQMYLGAEVARTMAEMSSGLSSETFTEASDLPDAEIAIVTRENSVRLKTDSLYYYMVGVRDGQISVSCMAHDTCTEMFELRSPSVITLIERIAADDRFERYDLDFLHRYYLGAEIGRAGIALENGLEYMQDFPHLFKLNTDDFPLVVAEGDTFLTTHIQLLRGIYTEGLTEPHGDEHKGLARTAGALAIFRAGAFSIMPRVYAQGTQSTEVLRRDYRDELLRTEHDGSYNYGSRTLAYFGYDQLRTTVDNLRGWPECATIIQRYDPATDMSLEIDPETGRQESSHDPCLTHDVYYISNGQLNVLHLARAHNAVNAYPQNLFGLHDAYDSWVAEKVDKRLRAGDTFMLSSRANVLLLTEEQRVKKLLSEPFKPMDTERQRFGPYRLGPDMPLPPKGGGLAYGVSELREVRERPDCRFLRRIEDYQGVNTLERAIRYLREKGVRHNNPVLSSYLAGEDDPTVGQLVFFQANVMGGKLHATAVYSNRHLDRLDEDEQLANYLATCFADELQVPLGKLTFATVGYKK